MQDQRLISPGPYRATKLWGEVTRLFRAGMPVRRHRLHLRSHDRCFTSAEAADWLHALLRDNRNFGPTVTREQTLQLLGKFLKNHVMEDVKGRWGTEAVRDDSKLYRFPVASPAKSMSGGSRQPLSERNSGSAARRRLGLKADAPPSLWSAAASPARAKATFNPDEWRNVALALLCEALSLPSLAGLLDPASVDPTHIVRNVQAAGRRGLVTLQDDTDDLPHWVLTAMKCLANWPGSEAGRSESYPGFERDVFGSVSQHFCSLADPLLTFPLYRLFVSVLEGAGREAACVAALRVCCLLLPPPSRRRLQLVARMAARAIANGRLPPLHATRGTRAHIVESLAPCVLRARDGEGAEGDALVSARLLTLLVENHGEVLFSIPEPLARLARGESSAERTPPRMQVWVRPCARSYAPSPVRPITGSSEHPRRSASDGSVSPRDRRKRSQEYPASPPRLQQLDAQRPRDAAKGPARTRPSIKPPLLLLAMTKPFKRKSSLRC
ncbi:unnamed protein product [Lampetra planeri]